MAYAAVAGAGTGWRAGVCRTCHPEAPVICEGRGPRSSRRCRFEGSSYKRLAERQGSVAPPRASRAGSVSKGQGMLRHATVKHLSSTEGLLPTPEQAVLIRNAIALKRRKLHPGNMSHLKFTTARRGFQHRQRVRRERVVSLSIPKPSSENWPEHHC